MMGARVGALSIPLLLAAALAAGCASPRPAACEALLRRQAEAWSRGDLDGFVDGYARSPDLVFATAEGVHVGFEAMVARYRARYPDAAAMGRLTFTELRFTDLSPTEVLATGGWRLERQA